MMNLYRDPFFCVPHSVHPTSQGDVALPILYFDSTAVLAFFQCARKSVETILPNERILPALTWVSRAIVGLAFFEYRTTSIGTYNEVGLAVPVLWQKGPVPPCSAIDLLRSAYTRRVGFHIVDLPVTTEKAYAAGRELWGYPKFVTPIDFSLQKKQLHSCVHDPGQNDTLLTFAGKLGFGLPSPALDLVTFECGGDQDRRTIIQTRGGGRLHGPGNVRLELGASPHPMAARLRQLALDGAHPLAIWVSTRFQSRLNAGAPLMPPTQRD